MDRVIGESARLAQGFIILFCSYALGSFITGYYLVRWRTGTDIRQLGSGSVDAKNVGRFLGRCGFMATALADFVKGALAVWATLRVAKNDQLAVIAMIAAVMGHIWPMQLGLRSGKGVVTSLGAILILDFRLALVFLGLFLIAFVLLRRTVWSGFLAFALLPPASLFLGPGAWPLAGVSVLVAMILIAHRENVFPGVAAQSACRSVPFDSTQLPR